MVAKCYKVTISKDMSPRCQVPMTGFGVAHLLMIFICTRSSGSTDHCGAVVQITYCSSDLCWSAGGDLDPEDHRFIWLMDFGDFQESGSVAEAPQM